MTHDRAAKELSERMSNQKVEGNDGPGFRHVNCPKMLWEELVRLVEGLKVEEGREPRYEDLLRLPICPICECGHCACMHELDVPHSCAEDCPCRKYALKDARAAHYLAATERGTTPPISQDALVDARERGYDDACSVFMAFVSQDAEADYRKWRELNPSADLRSAWIAGRANEASSQGVNLTRVNVAGYVKGFKAAQEYETTVVREPDLVIERMPDWNYGAFLNASDASCIAIGETAQEALNNGMRELLRRATQPPQELEGLLKQIAETPILSGHSWARVPDHLILALRAALTRGEVGGK